MTVSPTFAVCGETFFVSERLATFPTPTVMLDELLVSSVSGVVLDTVAVFWVSSVRRSLTDAHIQVERNRVPAVSVARVHVTVPAETEQLAAPCP